MLTAPVSVVIPTYNRAALLPRALQSVFRQDLAVAEVVVIDDGSSDGTEHLLNTIRPPPGIAWKILRQENQGPAAARNLGIASSSQPLIAFLDSDDHWHRTKIAVQCPLLLANEEFMISHSMEKWLYRSRHKNQKAIHIPRQGDIFTHCLRLCAVGMSTVLLRQKLFDKVGNFDETLPCCEDYDLWLRVSCRFPFLLVNRPLTVKEGGREDQLSTRLRQGMDRYRLRSLAKLLAAGLPDSHRQLLAHKELCRRANIYARGCTKHGDIETASTVTGLVAHCRQTSLAIYPELKEMI